MEKIYIVRFLGRRSSPKHGFFFGAVKEHTVRIAFRYWPSMPKIVAALDDGGYDMAHLRSITAEGV